MVTKKARENPVTVVPHVKIKEVGSFNFKKLYSEIAAWFDKNHYLWQESCNQTKVLPDGEEMKIEWKAERKVDDYTKFDIFIQFWIYYFVEEEGGYASADLEISITSKLVKNYHKKFSERKGTFSNFMREIYEGYLIRDRLLKYEFKLWAETYDFIDRVKEALEHAKRK